MDCDDGCEAASILFGPSSSGYDEDQQEQEQQQEQQQRQPQKQQQRNSPPQIRRHVLTPRVSLQQRQQQNQQQQQQQEQQGQHASASAARRHSLGAAVPMASPLKGGAQRVPCSRHKTPLPLPLPIEPRSDALPPNNCAAAERVGDGRDSLPSRQRSESRPGLHGSLSSSRSRSTSTSNRKESPDRCALPGSRATDCTKRSSSSSTTTTTTTATPNISSRRSRSVPMTELSVDDLRRSIRQNLKLASQKSKQGTSGDPVALYKAAKSHPRW